MMAIERLYQPCNLDSSVLNVFLINADDDFKKLIDSGYDVNKRSETHGDTLLTLLANNRRIDRLNILLNYHPDISATVKGDWGRTVFFQICWWDYTTKSVDLVYRLLDMDETGDILLIRDARGDNVIEYLEESLKGKMEFDILDPYDELRYQWRMFLIMVYENHVKKKRSLFNMLLDQIDIEYININKKGRFH